VKDGGLAYKKARLVTRSVRGRPVAVEIRWDGGQTAGSPWGAQIEAGSDDE
jgi:hypothetical protein